MHDNQGRVAHGLLSPSSGLETLSALGLLAGAACLPASTLLGMSSVTRGLMQAEYNSMHLEPGFMLVCTK